MRIVLVGLVALVAAVYSTGAIYFWTQERRAQSIDAARSMPVSELHHPEATLALIRDGMEQKDFSPRVGELVTISKRQLPSFYQPHVYQALFHANRLEAPDRTAAGFEAALERFPANGRLHLDYARWLLRAPSLHPSVASRREKAERHLTTALGVESTLTQEALETLARYDVPPERWADLVPDGVDARRRLVVALARGGHRDEALEHLRPLVERMTNPASLRQAAHWALSWGDPALALRVVEAWEKTSHPGADPHEPGLLAARAHLALGEMDAAYDVFRATLDDVGASSSSGLKLLCGMAEEYYRLGRYVLAESIFSEATSYSPSYVRALLGLARIHVRGGEDDEASAYYEKILRVDPDNARAQKELTDLMVRRRMRGRD